VARAWDGDGRGGHPAPRERGAVGADPSHDGRGARRVRRVLEPRRVRGGKGFPGGSVVVSPAGQIVLRGPLFEEAVLTADIGLEELTRARADAPLLADLEVNLPHLLKDLGKREKGKGKGKARSVQFDPASNGAFAQSAIRNPQ